MLSFLPPLSLSLPLLHAAPRDRPLSRRHAVGLSVSCALFRPPAASAGLFSDGPVRELQQLSEAKTTLDSLASQVEGGALGTADEASIVVLRTISQAMPSGVAITDCAALMGKAAAAMPKLSADAITSAGRARSLFAEDVEALRDACRRRDKPGQVRASQDASAALTSYLSAAGSAYAVEQAEAGRPYSSDPETFAAQYFGLLSCEGQGLKRIPGSNACGERVAAARGAPTLLDRITGAPTSVTGPAAGGVDLITGKKR